MMDILTNIIFINDSYTSTNLKIRTVKILREILLNFKDKFSGIQANFFPKFP